MKKIFKDYRFYICILITISLLTISILFYKNSYLRIAQSLRDLALSIGYNFSFVFDLDLGINITVNNIESNMKIANSLMIPIDIDIFKEKIKIYFTCLTNPNNLTRYISNICKTFLITVKTLMIILPLLILMIALFNLYFSESKKGIGEESKPLRFVKRIEKHIYKPVKSFFMNIIFFIHKNKYFYLSWMAIGMLSFNIFTIILEFFSYYFYFVSSFDITSLFIQLYKLILDLLPMITSVPIFIWILLALILVDKNRKKIAMRKLNHFENCDKGFIASLGQSTIICGSMGKGKTTLMTDLALSTSCMFKDKAFEKLLDNDLLFPHFPFQVLENDIKIAIYYHQIYSLETCKIYVEKKKDRFYKNPSIEKIYGYDYSINPLSVNDGLKDIDIFTMLLNYVQLFFIYVSESSLILSNYSIREDNILIDNGYFPLWDENFFSTDKERTNYSTFSHILDMDMVRLGKKIVENNIKKDALEFGVVVISEAGKERGNMLDNKELKKSDAKANQKNDNFNMWLKMVRHQASVDNYPFIKIYMDEQRPESLSADIRELCDKIIYIEDRSDIKVPLLFYRLEKIFYDIVSSIFNSIYYKYRSIRGDDTLLFYLIKKLYSRYHSYIKRLENNYSFRILKLTSKKGTLDDDKEENKYYLMNKKIYSDRFVSDAFSDYFSAKAKNSSIGISDLDTFNNTRASIEELKSENSYFINELVKYNNKGEDRDEEKKR